MGRIWNSENARLKKEELYALPDNERIKQAQTIRYDLKNWALQNFCFSDNQLKCLEMLPPDYLDETGFLLARAIEKRYNLTILVSDDSTPPAMRKRGDSVEGGWSQSEGWHVGYKFEF